MLWLEKLREMKATSGKTTQEISAQTGVPEATLEKLFAGVTKDPRLNTIAQVVHYLGYTLDDLLPAAAGDDLLRTALLASFDQLNRDGQERLVDLADDMVAGGKYIKTHSPDLVEGQA